MPTEPTAATNDGWTGTWLYPSLCCDYCGDEVFGSDAPSLDGAKEAHRENCPEQPAAHTSGGTAVPPGNCPTHGYHGRTYCPRCSTSAIPPPPLGQAPSAATRQPRREFGRGIGEHLLVLTIRPWRRLRFVRPCCDYHAWALEFGPFILRWER